MDIIKAKIPNDKKIFATGETITEASIPIGEHVPNPNRVIGAVIPWAPTEAAKSAAIFLGKNFENIGKNSFSPKAKPAKAP